MIMTGFAFCMYFNHPFVFCIHVQGKDGPLNQMSYVLYVSSERQLEKLD